MYEPSRMPERLLLGELRVLVAAAVEDGAEPRRVTADLEQRLRLICDLRRAVPRPPGSTS